MKLGGLGDYLVAPLRLPVQDEKIRMRVSQDLCQGPGPVGCRHDVIRLDHCDELGGPRHAPVRVVLETPGFVLGEDGDHPVQLRSPLLGRIRQTRDGHEDRYQDRRAHEDDEAGEELGAGEKLQHRHDQIGCGEGAEGSGDTSPQRTDGIGEPCRVAGSPHENDEDKHPAETWLFSKRVNMPSYVV